jgi:multidrug efflux pump subunit AcrA (membrane-fusion protein)
MDKKQKRNLTIGILVLFGLMVILTGRPDKADGEVEYAEAQFGKFDVTIEVAGTLEAESCTEIKGPDIANNRNVRAQSLTISDLVTEGTVVKKGDYVAMFDRTEFQNTLTSYQEDLESLLLSHENLLLDSAVKLSGLRDNIVNQRYVVENSRTTLTNSQFESAGTIRTAELNLQKEENSLQQLLNSYELSIEQIMVRIANSNTNISRMRQRITDYQTVLSSFYITAPADGMVVYAKDFSGSKIKTGSSVNMMQNVVATLPDLSSMLSKVYVSEIDINKLSTGMYVQLKVDAFPSKLFTGKISKVAKVGEKLANSDSKVFEVYIKLDKVDSQLRPDMTTTNTIRIASFEDVVYIPSAAVHTGADSVTVVYTKSGKKQVVVLGSSNSENIIIEQGLKKGDIVYLTTPQKAEKFRLSGQELIDAVKEQKMAKHNEEIIDSSSSDKSLAGL